MVSSWGGAFDVLERSSAAGGTPAALQIAPMATAVHGPMGEFATVDGTRLHYLARGTGVPVVLLHGNGSMIGDFIASGVFERVAPGCRVIAFDRPGFGHSERPHGRLWTPSEQASLLLKAFTLLGIERPVIVGHSWGALVALALAMQGPERVAGLVLLSGYYYPTPRSDMLAIAQVAMLNPFVRGAIATGAIRRVFAPLPVPERFHRTYSLALALRPSQLRAVREESAMLTDAAGALSRRYAELSVPVRIIAGADDRIVETDKHSARLHRQIAASTFRRVPGSGHMVHHAVPEEVVDAIAAIGEVRQRASRPAAKQGKSLQRRWLHIGDNPVERHLGPVVG
jgi:pimeloyl-ACP methyl ester carboxylesterase